MTWSREQAESSVGEHLWRYSGAARFAHHLTEPAALGEAITEAAFDTVLKAHLALSPAVSTALSAASQLLTRTPGTVFSKAVELVGVVEGSVDWPATFERQLASGDETLFVCRFGRRRFETLATRMLHTALVVVEELTRPLAHEGRDVDSRATTALEQARVLQRHQKLSGVRVLRHPSEAQLNRVSAIAGMEPIVDLLRLVMGADRREDWALRRLFRDVLLAPADDDRLFELQTGFELVQGFAEHGWHLELLQAAIGTRMPFASMTRSDDAITIWHQRSIGSLPGFHGASMYSHYRVANGLAPSSLIPDFVVQLPGGRTVLVEVKLTLRSTSDHVRHGISDAMAYLQDYPALFLDNRPHALVVAWGVPATPDLNSAIAVAGLSDAGVLAQLAA